MLALAATKIIDLPATGRQRSRILAAHAEQDQLGNVAKVETDTAPIGASILTYLVPDEIALVLKTPCLHDMQSLGKESVRHPQIQVAHIGHPRRNRKTFYLIERERVVPLQALVLRRH